MEGHAIVPFMHTSALRWLYAQADSIHHAQKFRHLTETLVSPQPETPKKSESSDAAADILAAIAADLGDTDL